MVLRLSILGVLALMFGCSGPAPTSPEIPVPKASIAASASDLPDLAPKVEAAVVNRIVDGDTARMSFRTNSDERVRFIGMDTPESGRPYFSEASSYAASQLRGKRVYLEVDVQERDRFGRLLAYVWLSIPTSGERAEVAEKMFNAKALLDGYAAILTVPPNVRYVEFFKGFQTEAREANRGLWGLSETTPSATATGNCDPSYPDVCIPPSPPDLDCGEIAHRRFRVLPPEPHGFDGRDHDGIGCES